MANEKRLIDANALKANFVVLGEFAKDLWHAGTIRMAIDNAPTVDAVEVVHGRWIIGTGKNALMPGCRMCSECGEIIKTEYSLYGMSNYCHYCGAKMDGDRND